MRINFVFYIHKNIILNKFSLFSALLKLSHTKSNGNIWNILYYRLPLCPVWSMKNLNNFPGVFSETCWWVKHLLCEFEDRSLDPHLPNKSHKPVIPTPREETGDPQAKLASLTNWIDELTAWEKNINQWVSGEWSMKTSNMEFEQLCICAHIYLWILTHGNVIHDAHTSCMHIYTQKQ